MAELNRLSQGSGLTYDERRHLANTESDSQVDPAFVARRLTALRRAKRWQSTAIAAVAGLATVLIAIASEGRPSAISLLLILVAFAMVALKRVQIERKIRVYESLATAPSLPAPASRIRS